MTELPAWISEIEERANAATPGPWTTIEDDDYYQYGTYVISNVPDTTPHYEMDHTRICRLHCDDPTGVFLIHSRTDIPRLIEAVKKLETALAEMKATALRCAQENERLRKALELIAQEATLAGAEILPTSAAKTARDALDGK